MVQFINGQILMVGGQIALSPDCCCDQQEPPACGIANPFWDCLPGVGPDLCVGIPGCFNCPLGQPITLVFPNGARVVVPGSDWSLSADLTRLCFNNFPSVIDCNFSNTGSWPNNGIPPGTALPTSIICGAWL